MTVSHNDYPYEVDLEALQELQQKFLDNPQNFESDLSELRYENELMANLLMSIDLNRLDEIRVKKQISQEELDEIIESHEKWLDGEKGGKCANLSNLDLSYLDFHDHDLSGVSFYNARLKHADLSNCDFICCDFRYADMFGPSVEHSCFYEADMRNSKMAGFYPQNDVFYGAHLSSGHLTNGIIQPTTDEDISKIKEHIKEPKERLMKALHKKNIVSAR